MSESPLPTVVEDAARGPRRVHRAADGTSVRIERADGSVVVVERDDRRRSLRVADADGELLSLRADGDRVVATDRLGVTEAARWRRTTRTRRDGATLRVDRDGRGRPARVTVPGSTADIVYRQVGAGEWQVESSLGQPIMTISTTTHRLAVRMPDGWGWVEDSRRGDVELRAIGGQHLASTMLDIAGRIVGRTSPDGTVHRYWRDAEQRLVCWDAGGATTEWTFAGHSVTSMVRNGRRRSSRHDDGARVVAERGAGPTVRFRYDATGQRTERHGPGGVTRYAYDALGQLTSIEHADGTLTEIGWDGLGRQIWVERDGARRHEHRDLDGRLWAVTEADGRAVHTFVWWDGRVVARMDGPVGVPVAEVYLTDPVGTLVAVGIPSAAGEWAVSSTVGDPYGAPTGAYRPSLFGHIGHLGGGGAAGLIPFGSRHFDPETATFLTPDPWHLGADDPRVLAGTPVVSLALNQESPRAGVHPYALGQFDPLSRPDLDGHFAWGNFFLTLILAPTWGFPLTSLSLFFFLPVNLYFELIGLIVFIFTDHPWPQHSMANLKAVAGSAQLGTFGFALNGFLPRVISGGGVDADRAVTIGHVVWANRRYFELLDRPRVLTVQDVGGPPDANGLPSGGPTAFATDNRGSIVVVEGTDDDGRKWLHTSWWTRGGGSHVGTNAVGDPVFEDRVAAGTAHSTGSLLLAQPLPEIMAAPTEADDDEVLRVVEYLRRPNPTPPPALIADSDGEIVQDQWFAIGVDAVAGLVVGDAVRIQADDDAVAPAFAGIHQVIAGEDPIVVLDHPLPARFQVTDLKEDLELAKLSLAAAPDAGNSANWAVPPNPLAPAPDPLAPDRRTLEHAAPGHRLRIGDVVAVRATPNAPPPERPVIYGAIETLRLTLQFTVPPPAGQVGATVLALSADGTVATATVPDPAANPADVAITGDHELEVGDLVAVHPSGGGAHHARITTVTAADPAVVTLDPPIPAAVVSAAGAAVNLARLRPADDERDRGAVDAQTAPTLMVSGRSTELFPVGAGVQLDQGGTIAVRTVSAVTATRVVLVDDMIGAGAPAIGPAFEITIQQVADDTADGEIAADRFVRHTGGPLPATYGDYPAEVLGLVPTAYPAGREPLGWRFFYKTAAPIADIHPDFRDYWQPLTLGTEHYWLLGSPLKIVENDGRNDWEPDPDDTYPRRHRQNLGAPPWAVRVRGFARAATSVERPLAGGDKVLCRPAETQVPVEPQVRWSLADALDEHELGHTLQNTYWGPLLGALPLQGLFRTVAETRAATGEPEEDFDWMLWNPFNEAGDEIGFDDLNLFELLSFAGLMQLVWTFVILGPALANDDARHHLLGLNFADWGQVFNPISQQIVNHVPEIDPQADAGDRWGLWVARLFTKALDMRSWTPLVGLVPLLLPDAPTNFVEQQASRWTGDLYSTILTVNERSNRTLRLRPGGALLSRNREADRTVALGASARAMSFYSGPLDRFLPLDRCAASVRLTYIEEFFTSGGSDEFVRLAADTSAVAGGIALLPQGHFQRAPGTPGGALATRVIDGPEVPDPANPGATMRPPLTFLDIANNDVLEPLPRALVPVAPAVVRAVGFYLLGASPARYVITAHETDTAGDRDSQTYTATVTVGGEVTVGGQPVPWTMPLASGAAGPPPAPANAANDISRFVTEKAVLAVGGQDTSRWKAEVGTGLAVAPVAGGNGWTLTFSDPGTPLPTRARVRVWRPVEPDDAELFDFVHVDEPTRDGIRSYLDASTWIPIRDFSVEIADVPPLAAAAVAAADRHELALAIAVAGAGSIVVTPVGGRTLVKERLGDNPPRGERWGLQLDGQRAVEAPVVFRVTVTFGTAPTTVDRPFDLTVNPNFTIDTAPAGGPYVVSEVGGALTLQIAGGTAPFEVASDLPAGVTATVDATTITVTADASAVAGTHVLVVRDDDDRLGVRQIRVEA